MKRGNRAPKVNSYRTIILSGVLLILFVVSLLFAQTKGYEPNVASYGYGMELFKAVDHYFGVNGVYLVLILMGVLIIFAGLCFRAHDPQESGVEQSNQPNADKRKC